MHSKYVSDMIELALFRFSIILLVDERQECYIPCRVAQYKSE